MITQDFTKPIDSATVLQKIVLDKAQWVKAKEAEFPLSQFKENIPKSDRSFYIKNRLIFWNVKKLPLLKD